MILTEQQMRAALNALDQHLKNPIRLIMGGGGAMLLAHHFPLSTSDIDAVPASGSSLEELDAAIRIVAKELGISEDWLNPYYSTFTHVLPADYGNRLIPVVQLKNLEVLALSKEDLLIMKCFAGRMKDRPHAKVLIRQGADLEFVESHIESLSEKGIPGAQKALDFLDEVNSDDH